MSLFKNECIAHAPYRRRGVAHRDSPVPGPDGQGRCEPDGWRQASRRNTLVLQPRTSCAPSSNIARSAILPCFRKSTYRGIARAAIAAYPAYGIVTNNGAYFKCGSQATPEVDTLVSECIRVMASVFTSLESSIGGDEAATPSLRDYSFSNQAGRLRGWPGSRI